MREIKIRDFFESLNQDCRLDIFNTIYADKVAFKDPFNKVFGIEAVYNIFAHMYKIWTNQNL